MDCPLCEVVSGKRETPGGVLWREDGFVLHALAGPSPLRGWLVLTSERHVRAVYDLDDAESGALGPLMRRVMRAQREALGPLGCEHVYAFAIGDMVHHCHVHLVPRFADTPAHLRGAKCFDARPEEMLAEDLLAEAARSVAAVMRPG